MKIKFNKKAVKAINKWLKKNKLGVECVLEKGGELQYDPNDNLIIIPTRYDDEPDGLFMKCLRNLGLTSDFDAVTLSILHEIGHAQTVRLFTNKEYLEYSLEKLAIAMGDDAGTEKSYFKYWEVKDELAANNWAILYTKSFENKVEKLENIIEEYVKFG